MILYQNPSANVCIHVLLTDGSRIYHQIYSWDIEMLWPTFSSEDSSSIAAFQHSMDLNAFELDMRDKVTFWSLTPWL